MFNEPFNYRRVRSFRQAIAFYLVHWVLVMIGSLALGLPAALWWGARWQVSAEEYFKFSIVATHAVCSVVAFVLAMQMARAKNIHRSWLVVLMAILGALLSSMFASPTTPLIAATLSVRQHGQTNTSTPELALFIVLLVLSALIFVLTSFLQGV